MTMPGKLVTLAALAIATASSGCLYQREVVREPPPPVVQNAPPPAPSEPLPPPADEDSSGAIAEDQNVPAPGADVTDDRVFYERLAPYGHWEWVPDYGRVWVPAVAPGWRPYVYGRWVLTDWGWTWVSDDPWGWAAYHYGSWGFTVGIGWYWVPGRIWAPAWVSWRYGHGYCAWAPIGPRGFVYGAYSPAWVAIREQHFTQPVSVHAVAVQQTGVIVQRATPLQARPASRSGTFGPPVAHVAAATGQAIRPVSAGSVVGPRAQPVAVRSSPANAGPSASGRAQASPTQSPRAQSPTQSPRAGGWRSRNWSQSGTNTRSGSSSGTARPWGSWGAARAGGSSAGRPSSGSPSASGSARAAPSAPSTSGGGHAPAARGSGSGSSGGGGHSSGGAHASGGHGHR